MKNLILSNPDCSGNHHVKHQINILEGTYSLPCYGINGNEIDLSALKARIIDKYF